MPQINDIRELAQQNARYVSNSPQDWMSYLDVAARLYRYSFTDALLIHAQRPDATACAEMELWNQKMSRWVTRFRAGAAFGMQGRFSQVQAGTAPPANRRNSP